MELLSIKEIIQSIEEETKGLDPELIEEMSLREVNIPLKEIEYLKAELNINVLNQGFIDSVLKYGWGNFGFLSYQFGYDDDNSLHWIVERNVDYEDYSTLNKNGLIIIANGDPYTILLECAAGRIYCIDSETCLEHRMLIANSFEQLVQAMGTGQYACWKEKETEFVQLMAHITDGEGMLFWKSLVGCY